MGVFIAGISGKRGVRDRRAILDMHANRSGPKWGRRSRTPRFPGFSCDKNTNKPPASRLHKLLYLTFDKLSHETHSCPIRFNSCQAVCPTHLCISYANVSRTIFLTSFRRFNLNVTWKWCHDDIETRSILSLVFASLRVSKTSLLMA